MKILVVRNDGLGDLILTLPLLASIKKQLPDSEITLLIKRNLVHVVELFDCVDNYLIDDGILLKRDFHKFDTIERKKKQKLLSAQLKEMMFDLAIVPYSEYESAKILYLSGIPLRMGSIRKPHFFFFNRWFLYSRKNSDLTEYQLNLKYLKLMGLKEEYVHPQLKTEKIKKNIYPHKNLVIHPYKKSKTSLGWPVEKYETLVSRLTVKYMVAIIGDMGDGDYLFNIFGKYPNVTIYTEIDLRQMSELIYNADLFIGNSSGPLHLAAVLAVPHIGFFPNASSVSSRRWKTLPSDDETSVQLIDSLIPCKRQICKPVICGYENCLDSININDVCVRIKEL